MAPATQVPKWLHILVDTFHKAPEDIVKQSKYGSEPLGGRTVMLDQLQATLGDDVQAAALADQIENAEFELDQFSIQVSFVPPEGGKLNRLVL